MQHLKKHTRSHKYRELLSPSQIQSILEKYVREIDSFPKLNDLDSNKYPEVEDMYNEQRFAIVLKARADLQREFRLKAKKMNQFALNEYLKLC